MPAGYYTSRPITLRALAEAIESYPGPTFESSGVELRFENGACRWYVPDTPNNADLIKALRAHTERCP